VWADEGRIVAGQTNGESGLVSQKDTLSDISMISVFLFQYIYLKIDVQTKQKPWHPQDSVGKPP